MLENIFETMNLVITSKKKKAIISIQQKKQNKIIYRIHYLANIIIDPLLGLSLDLEKIEQLVDGYNIGLQDGKRYLVDMEFDKENLRPKFDNFESEDNMTFFNFLNGGKDIQKSINVQKR